MSFNSSQLSIRPESIVMLISLLIIGAVTYFLAMPQAGKLKAQSAQLQQKQTEHKALEDKRNALVDLSQRIDQYQADIERLGVAYPREEQAVEALIQAQQMAQRAGLGVTSLTPSKATNGSLAIAMTLKGSYDGLVKMLYEIDANLRPITVHSVSITPASEKDAGLLTLNLTTTFAYNSAAAAATPDAAGAVPPAEAGAGATQSLAAPVAPATQ